MPSTDVLSDVPVAGGGDLFSCDVRVSDRAAWVQPRGELDLATAPALEDALDSCRLARLLILDLRGLSFIDSSGGHLIEHAAANAHRSGRRLMIVRGPARVHRLLTLGRFIDGVPVVGLPPGVRRTRTGIA